MKREEVKDILEHYRAGDELTPPVSEALASLESNAELARWYAAKNSFDQRMAEAVSQIPIPVELKSAILSLSVRSGRGVGERWIRIGPLIAWWKRPVSLAAAAAVLLFTGAVGLWLSRPAHTFAEYRQEVIDESWGRSPHLDVATSDIGEINKWLATVDPHGAVTIPSGLSDLTLHGGRTLEWNGHRIVLLCLSQGPRHMHLFITTDRAFPDLPAQGPDYEKCSGWKTVSWTQGNRTYILTGMNYLTFLKKFRHSGHWTMDG